MLFDFLRSQPVPSRPLGLGQKLGVLLTILLWASVGCTPPPPETASSPSPQPEESITPAAEGTEPVDEESPVTAEQPAEENTRISSEGIGAARLGMTLAALKEELGDTTQFEVKSPFIVDFDAIAVSQAGQVQYYILYLAGEPFTDEDVIQGLMTDNPAFRTREEVGPGTTVAKAVEEYGAATLSYNTDNESREYVRFEDQPAPNISFATGNANESTAGVYPSAIADFNETQEYKPDATIKSVLVVCLAETCVEPEAEAPE